MNHKFKIGDSKVLESREALDGTMIRRRRVTSDGKYRFTTYERIEMPSLMVKKRSGEREAFDRDKLVTSIRRSVGKFLNSELEVEEVVEKAMDILYELGTETVTSEQIGEAVLEVLSEMNEVAYVRYSSVFRKFKTLDEFEEIIRKQREKASVRKGDKSCA
ncbi:transcriptional repressor NrdR [Candidatus Saccharibacteria bacterium]|nr:transcriptional repressor NrdR [Candidatus Saccharibacteria bacterium]